MTGSYNRRLHVKEMDGTLHSVLVYEITTWGTLGGPKEHFGWILWTFIRLKHIKIFPMRGQTLFS